MPSEALPPCWTYLTASGNPRSMDYPFPRITLAEAHIQHDVKALPGMVNPSGTLTDLAVVNYHFLV